MAWPWLAVIVKNVPWVELVRRAPDILARSRELLEQSKRPRPGPAGDADRASGAGAGLGRRIDALEGRDAEHARIIAAMVDQLAGLTDAVQVLTARSKLLGTLVAILLVAQTATIVAMLR